MIKPVRCRMYAEAQLALIGMDDYEDALQLEAQAKRAGVVSTGNSLIAGYLAGNEDVTAKQASAKQVAFAGTTTAHGAVSLPSSITTVSISIMWVKTGSAQEGMEGCSGDCGQRP